MNARSIAYITAGLLCLHSSFATPVLPMGSSPSGEALAKQMLNSNVLPSLSSQSGNNTMQGLGVSAQTIGSPSSDQVNSMGVSGSLISDFDFTVKPACSSMQTVSGLNGSQIQIPCESNSENGIAAKACIPNANDTTNCTYQAFNLPTNGSTVSALGFNWKGSCTTRGDCIGTMSQTNQVSGNSNNMNQQGAKARVNSPAYNSVYNTYVGQNGYSKTQAYMKSFQNNGSNSYFAKCAAGAAGYIANGIYYSCSGNQQGDLYNNCKTVKQCIKYQEHITTKTTDETCDLVPGSQTVSCTNTPSVNVTTTTNKFTPCEYVVPNGQDSLYSGPYPGANSDGICDNGYIAFPVPNRTFLPIKKSVTVDVPKNTSATLYLSMVQGDSFSHIYATATTSLGQKLSFGTEAQSIQTQTANFDTGDHDQITLSISATYPTWRGNSGYVATFIKFQGVTVVKTPHITWSELCPTS